MLYHHAYDGLRWLGSITLSIPVSAICHLPPFIMRPDQSNPLLHPGLLSAIGPDPHLHLHLHSRSITSKGKGPISIT